MEGIFIGQRYQEIWAVNFWKLRFRYDPSKVWWPNNDCDGASPTGEATGSAPRDLLDPPEPVFFDGGFSQTPSGVEPFASNDAFGSNNLDDHIAHEDNFSTNLQSEERVATEVAAEFQQEKTEQADGLSWWSEVKGAIFR